MQSRAITRCVLAFIVFVSTVFLLGLTQAQAKPAGYVQLLHGDVVAVNASNKSRSLRKKSPVFSNDTVITKRFATVQIFFEDGTKLRMAPESMLSIKKYSFREATSNGVLNFLLGTGIMRILTGKLTEKNPSNFSLESPNGVLGVRGTETCSIIRLKEGAGARASLIQALASGQGVREFVLSKGQGTSFKEEHAHVTMTKKRPLYFTDFNNKTEQYSSGKSVKVTRDKGVSKPGPYSSDMRKQLGKYRIDPNAPIPKAYAKAFRTTEQRRQDIRNMISPPPGNKGNLRSSPSSSSGHNSGG